jgi:hypothetical protein
MGAGPTYPYPHVEDIVTRRAVELVVVGLGRGIHRDAADDAFTPAPHRSAYAHDYECGLTFWISAARIGSRRPYATRRPVNAPAIEASHPATGTSVSPNT